jgi:hypothetical protein
MVRMGDFGLVHLLNKSVRIHSTDCLYLGETTPLFCLGVESLWEKVVPDWSDQEWDPENRDRYS